MSKIQHVRTSGLTFVLLLLLDVKTVNARPSDAIATQSHTKASVVARVNCIAWSLAMVLRVEKHRVSVVATTRIKKRRFFPLERKTKKETWLHTHRTNFKSMANVNVFSPRAKKTAIKNV